MRVGRTVTMGVVLATVAAPGGRAADLVLPADAPVARLLGPVVEAVLGPGATGGWALAGPGGDPLPAGRSLAACGVGDGAVLVLHGGAAGACPTRAPAGPPPAGVGFTLAGPPVPWPLGERVAIALRALAGREAQAPGGHPGPAGAARDGPAGRVREAWRATGYQRRLRAAVAAPVLDRCTRVAVLAAAPGVGATIVARLLAAALAVGRPGPTVAVDPRPGPGCLGGAPAPGQLVAADDLLDLFEHPALTWPELRAALGWAGPPLAVLGARADGSLGQRGWARVVGALARHASAVVVDCGPDPAAPAARGALGAADRVVLVSGPEPPRNGPLGAGDGRPVALVVNRPAPGLAAAGVLGRAPWAAGAVLLPEDPAGTAALVAAPPGQEPPPGRWRGQADELAALLLSARPAPGPAAVARRWFPDAAPDRPATPANAQARSPEWVATDSATVLSSSVGGG